MLTKATHLDVMNHLGRAMADPTRSRILPPLLDHPGDPVVLAEELSLTRLVPSSFVSARSRHIESRILVSRGVTVRVSDVGAVTLRSFE